MTIITYYVLINKDSSKCEALYNQNIALHECQFNTACGKPQICVKRDIDDQLWFVDPSDNKVWALAPLKALCERFNVPFDFADMKSWRRVIPLVSNPSEYDSNDWGTVRCAKGYGL